jgi:dTDP-4-dehydrorhamnose reductase
MLGALPGPLLLISPDGMLGRALVAALEARGQPFQAISYPELDLRDPDSVARALTRAPKLRAVINCAAYTDVDGAETHEADATAINGTGVQWLAERCKSLGALLVHYSTDYVFDGKASTPYPVDEPRRPQNAYGRSKAVGEEQLEASGCEQLLIRTSWLYAPWGKNFVDTIAKFGMERPVLKVVDDQRGRPTSAEYLAERTLALLERGARGTFHVTDGGECSWYEFARAIVEGTQGTAQVEPCTSAEFQRPASRPAYSVLDLGRTETLLGPSRSWQDNLHAVLCARRAQGARG